MTNDIHSEKTHGHGHGRYEHKDIGVSGVVYFLVGLTVALIVVYFVVDGFYHYLNHRFEAQQPAVSPLVNTAPADTGRLPPEYKTDSEGRDYEKYLEKNFPAPQLETDERTELNKIRLSEENTLSTYDYIDKSAGTVRIPIDRAMQLLIERGLPTRGQISDSTAVASAKSKAKETNTK